MPALPRVVALVAAYNEADVIGSVVRALVDEGVQVYFIDDGSTDDTVRQVEPFVNRGVIAIEQRRPPSRSDRFEWQAILERKAALARDLEADWFIHHDADEFRESPWAGLTLAEAVGHVDALGFNAIDFECLDFWPVRDNFHPGADVREALTSYSPSAPYDRVQIRCWKKTAASVDLTSSGGHEAQFTDRRVFPIRFLLRHYPVRGEVHGARKVFDERLPRFDAGERARGWHVQYDAFGSGTATFVRDAAVLTPYDGAAVRVRLSVENRDVEQLNESLTTAREQAARARDELDAARHEIATLRRDLSWACDQLTGAREALGHRASEVEVLAGRLDEIHQRLVAKDAETRTLHRSLEAALRQRHDDLRERDRTIASLSGRLDDVHARLIARERDAAALHDRLGRSLATAEAHAVETERFRGELARAQQEVERIRAAADAAAARVSALERSYTWRWTAPIRAIGGLFTRRR